MICSAKIRPLLSPSTEVECTRTDFTHTEHHGHIRDMAFPGSDTTVTWYEGDRRNYHGDYPGLCTKTKHCILPDGHPRECHVEL